MVDLYKFFALGFYVEVILYVFSAFLGELWPDLRVFDQVLELFGQGVWVFFGDQKAGFLVDYQFRDAAVECGDCGQAAGESFFEDVGNSFLIAEV